MPIKIRKVAELVNSRVIFTTRDEGNIATILTNLEPANALDHGPQWELPLIIGEGVSARSVTIELARFLSKAEYDKSFDSPILCEHSPAAGSSPSRLPRTLILFRDRFFVPDRDPMNETERGELTLRAKKFVYQEEEEFTSLHSFVSNVEAAIEYRKSGPKRDPIPEDVKMLVWARDGGACIRCGSKEALHFDHVIPVAKGGSNLAENIQLLCETCNLKKSDKIAF